MNYVKMIGLLAIVAAAFISLAATASASTLTSPTGTAYTGTLTAVSEGLTQLDGAFVTVACGQSHVEGKVEQHGNAVTAKGNISKLTFTECNYPVTVVKAGSLEIHAATHTGKGVETTGTVTSSGVEISIETSVGTCIFTTSATDIGTFTGSEDTKQTATLDIASAKIPRTGGSFLCGSSGTWTGAYGINTPGSLWLDATV